MWYQRSLEIENRLHAVLELIETGEYSTPGLATGTATRHFVDPEFDGFPEVTTEETIDYGGNVVGEEVIEDEQPTDTGEHAAIRPSHVLGYLIPLPPIDEQRQIVDKISSIVPRLEAATHLNTQVELQISRLAASLLEGEISSSGNTCRLADIIASNTRVSYGVLVPGPDVDDGVPFVRIQDLDPESLPAKPAKRIAKEIDTQYARTRLTGNEVLVAAVGATIGKIGAVPESWFGANIARAVCRIVPGPRIRREFLIAALQAHRVQNYFRDVTRTLAQPTLNVSQLLDTPISCPPLAAQDTFLVRLKSLNARLEDLRATRSATLTKMHAVIPSLLDHAFRGEL